MKQIITFLAIAFSAVACEKTGINNEKQVGAASEKVSGIVGTWQLVAYWEDVGTGSGRWVTPNYDERISFSAEGGFTSSPSFPLYVYGYNKYVAKENLVVFFPSSSGNSTDDSFQYSLNGSTMVFYPRCREQCMRMYKLVG